MIELVDIARREEARQVRGLREIADDHREFGGGIAGRGKPGIWINNAVGMALDGPVPRAELESVLAWYESAGVEPRFEVAPFVDLAFIDDCAALGMVVRAFENTFVRALDREESIRPLVDPPPELAVAIVDARDAHAVRTYSIVATSGFFPPGVSPREEDLAVSARAVRHPRTVAFTASLGGRVVGAGAMEVAGDIAGLFGLSVLPEFRRRGIQQALLAARLNEAARRGATLATISARPGIATERNVRRMGFQLAYTKVVLVRPGPGLAPVIG
ncbi:MAG: GNAT family N-acetyltransferase [Phycisphaerae bacterium]